MQKITIYFIYIAHQGSANIYTPASSNMDVTMISYDNNKFQDDDPFKNLEYSAIHPTPMQKSISGQDGVAWNISGFGGLSGAGLGDVSTIAQAGTPARNATLGRSTAIGGNNAPIGGYNYDGMYSDINLRGDNIGQVKKIKHENIINQNNININNNNNNNNNKDINITRAPPISPFSRKRDRRMNNKNNLKGNGMNDVAFTTIMGVKKSKFAAKYMEESIKLYESLHIDTLIANWAEAMRWWLGERVIERKKELDENNNSINQIFNLLINKYNLKQQLSQFVKPWEKISFILQNESQLLNVARSGGPREIPHIIQKTGVLKECIDFVCSNYTYNQKQNVVQYVYKRINTLSTSNNLQSFKWNKGDEQLWRELLYPNDAHLIMTLFCRYMDDVMCPAIKFSEKHYIQISEKDLKNINKCLYKKFKDIAIICVYDSRQNINKNQNQNNNNYNNNFGINNNYNNNNNNNNKDISSKDSLPYYFIAYNKKKFEKIIDDKFNGRINRSFAKIQKPRHFLNSAWNGINDSFNNYFNNNKGNNNNTNNNNNNNNNNLRGIIEEKNDLSDDDYNDYYHNPGGNINIDNNGRRRINKYNNKQKRRDDDVGTWFPQPGKNNLLHTITLFALFLHKCCNDKLAGIALKDQGCTLLQPILR